MSALAAVPAMRKLAVIRLWSNTIFHDDSAYQEGMTVNFVDEIWIAIPESISNLILANHLIIGRRNAPT